MNTLDFQKTYWDSVAAKKKFTHPIQIDRFREIVPLEGEILDYGCGYGRTCAYLSEIGYRHVIGVDISEEMIQRGLRMQNTLDLRVLKNGRVPFAGNTFAACTLLAVLTCIPTDQGQQTVMEEIFRVLQPGGILLLSDYPLQKSERYLERYGRFKDEFGQYGVFRLNDGGVLRHHDIAWIHTLLSRFEIVTEERMEVLTMNGNNATIFQIIARKCASPDRPGQQS